MIKDSFILSLTEAYDANTNATDAAHNRHFGDGYGRMPLTDSRAPFMLDRIAGTDMRRLPPEESLANHIRFSWH